MGLELFTNITPQSIVVFGIGILGFIIGSLVYSRDISRIDNLSFFLFAWCFSMWAMLLGAFESIAPGNLEYVSLMILYIFTALIPVTVLFFIMSLTTGSKIILTKTKIFSISVSFIVVLYIILTPNFLFKNIINSSSTKEIIFGNGLILFTLYLLMYTLTDLFLLFKKYRRSAGIFKTEMLYIFLSVFIGAVFVLLANIIFPYLDIYNLFWFGPLVGIFIIGIIGFLIIKYNFWNLKLAATDFFTSIISLVLLFELFSSNSILDFTIKTTILVLVLLSGVLLVRSVRYEIENREEAEKLVKQLAEVNDDLHILNEQKSEFVVTASRHLRGPLMDINKYTSMILDESFGSINDKAKEAIDRILQSSKRLVVIIEDFMSISKIESGKIDYKFSRTNLKEMIEELIEEMSITAKQNGLEIKLKVKKDDDFISNVDSGKIRQVISNLIDNAIKYTPGGFVNVSLVKNKNGKIIIKVSDTGIGMSELTLKKIFHQFSRAKEASKFHTGGSGLGLYIAREMLKRHDGRIWAESAGHGKGSTFCVELNDEN